MSDWQNDTDIDQTLQLHTGAALVGRARQALETAIVGQETVIEQVLICLLAGGHALIEGLPGLGKTLLVRALTKTFEGRAARIQFTPDLMPADIVGHVMYNNRTGEFQTHRGPVFANLLLADEINRAPAKTQAALLEAMQELQVTLEGTSEPLPSPFMTLATQNPLEHKGTYPLPDAQLDRFLLKVHMTYPESDDEVEMVQKVTRDQASEGLPIDHVPTVMGVEDIMNLRRQVAAVHVDDRITRYAVDTVRATRAWPGLSQGAGPRGGLALVRAARAAALMQGRDFATPDDIKAVALPALRHRIVLAPDAELEGSTADDVVNAVVDSVDAPRL